ncbi:hydroxymethylglutaryl-CoA lyase [Bacillus fonticola]|uniref:hydroxymethylglutaryl-CoA lyase n=1 Tax=Bacillus fonticola TaxID=2728853 RepID=UPI001472B600|nr:hydroxymethylglutaryl-CoA lyase [Bacillus fonticola]
MSNDLPQKVTIIEVGPRDGLQNEKEFVPTEAKERFLQKLADSGCEEMEITSFVSPKWVPQMQDAAELLPKTPSDLKRAIVLVPNAKGYERALVSETQAVAFFVGVSETFNKRNINRTTAESMEAVIPLVKDAKERGLFVRACISTSFHCPYEGSIDPEATIRLCNQFIEAGVDELSVADTTGLATPLEVYTLFSKLKETTGDVLLTAHFHDTYKMGLANVWSALQAGVTRFDSSVGGLGGCPFAKGATGNVATEEVVFMLERMGIDTSISIAGLLLALEEVTPHLKRTIDTPPFF